MQTSGSWLALVGTRREADEWIRKRHLVKTGCWDILDFRFKSPKASLKFSYVVLYVLLALIFVFSIR